MPNNSQTIDNQPTPTQNDTQKTAYNEVPHTGLDVLNSNSGLVGIGALAGALAAGGLGFASHKKEKDNDESKEENIKEKKDEANTAQDVTFTQNNATSLNLNTQNNN